MNAILVIFRRLQSSWLMAARVLQLFWAILDKLSSRTNIAKANMLYMLKTFISGQGQIGELFFIEIRNRRLNDRFTLMSAIYWNHVYTKEISKFVADKTN